MCLIVSSKVAMACFAERGSTEDEERGLHKEPLNKGALSGVGAENLNVDFPWEP